MLPTSEYHDPIQPEPDPHLSRHPEHPTANPFPYPENQQPSAVPLAATVRPIPPFTDHSTPLLDENSHHVPPVLPQSTAPEPIDVDTIDPSENAANHGNRYDHPESITSPAGMSSIPTHALTPHVDGENPDHVTACSPTKKPVCYTIAPTPEEYASRSAKGRGKKPMRSNEARLKDEIRGLSPDFQALIMNDHKDYTDEARKYPLFAIMVNPTYTEKVNSEVCLSYYVEVQTNMMKRQIRFSTNQLTEVQEKHAEYHAKDKFVREFSSDKATAKMLHHQELYKQCEIRYIEIDVDPMDETPDEETQQLLAEKSKLEKAGESHKFEYERQNKSLIEYDNAKSWLQANPINEGEIQEKRQQLKSLLDEYKIFAGSTIQFRQAESGYLVFDHGEFGIGYKELLPIVGDTFTKEELENYRGSYPVNYQLDVKRYFDNIPLCMTPPPQSLDDLYEDDSDDFERTAETWLALESCAIMRITSVGDTSPIQGRAIFTTNCGEIRKKKHIEAHFEESKVNYEIIREEPVDIHQSWSKTVSRKTLLKVYINFSFEGKAPKSWITDGARTTNLKIIRQTTTVCHYCRQPGHHIRDCLKYCDNCKQKHYSRNSCKFASCYACGMKHCGEWCEKASKKTKKAIEERAKARPHYARKRTAASVPIQQTNPEAPLVDTPSAQPIFGSTQAQPILGAIQESAVNDANGVHRKRKTRNQNVKAWKARQTTTTKPVPDADGWTVVPGRATPPVEKRQASPPRMENPFGVLSEDEADPTDDVAEKVEELQRPDWTMPVGSASYASFSSTVTQTSSGPSAPWRPVSQTSILPGQKPVLHDEDDDLYQLASQSSSVHVPPGDRAIPVDSEARL
ncbi:hypothetical protein DIRU0_B09450 [Diutina rugosa]